MEFNGHKLPDNVFDLLEERGLIANVTDRELFRDLLGKEKITFYIGYDPTADSLHVGHFLQLMIMRYMQMYGHRPIALIGGGTCMIGDPSGKADMRRVMPVEEIDANAEKFKVTMRKFIDFSDGKAIMVNNADWLRPLNYIDFLREVGWYFSVNKMLTAEAFKVRMERDIGLTFTEFNYMLMQGYDSYYLFNHYNCIAQFGGSDQWTNILAGTELIRKKDGKDAYGIIDPEGGALEMIVKDKSQVGGPLNQFSTIGYKFETNGATMLYPERLLCVWSCSSYSGIDEANYDETYFSTTNPYAT